MTSSGSPRRPTAKYEAALGALIVARYNLFDLPLPDTKRERPDVPSEYEQKRSVWAAALVVKVPFEELTAAFEWTRDHWQSSRAFGPLDIRQGYEAMVREREAERRRAEAEARRETAPPCRTCQGAKTRKVLMTALGDVEVELPCQDCRPKAFAEALKQWQERQGLKTQPAAPGSLATVHHVAGKVRCSQCGDVQSAVYKQEGTRCGRLLNGHGDGPVDVCKGVWRSTEEADAS